MKTCLECKWHNRGNYLHCHKDWGYFANAGFCPDFERKNMSIEDAYETLQEEWARLYNVEVGDYVRVLRKVTTTDELGSFFTVNGEEQVDGVYKVTRINRHAIGLAAGDYEFLYPFFCLEFVKKAQPEIDITLKINGKEARLSEISEETLLNIRRNSK